MTEGNDAHLKHILIYACDGFNPVHMGNGGVCEGGVGRVPTENISCCVDSWWRGQHRMIIVHYDYL